MEKFVVSQHLLPVANITYQRRNQFLRTCFSRFSKKIIDPRFAGLFMENLHFQTGYNRARQTSSKHTSRDEIIIVTKNYFFF